MGITSSQALLPLVNALRSGDLSLENYIDELETKFEDREPGINAFLPENGRFERLRTEAEALLKSYPNPFNRPPLFGVPIGVKDIFHVDGFQTQAGSKLPLTELKGREAVSVTRLKEAGALIMGKTVTTEFAYFAPGPTRNPHNLDHTPGGSSSGSAAAVAGHLCPMATGTQTIGSLIRPASYCGIIGFKPSYDRISRDGVIPLSPSLDHVGIFTNDVAGAELVASILCNDWHLVVSETMPVLGVPASPYMEQLSPEGMQHFQGTCERLVSSGCIIKSVPIMENFQEVVDRHNLILAAEAAQVHAHWFAEYRDLYDQRTIELIERGRNVSVGALAEAIADRRRMQKELAFQTEKLGLDLWISPAALGPASRGLESTGNPVMNLPWTHAGLPALNLPTGTSAGGLPLGMQITGHWYEDEKLLEWSAVLEKALN
jgi:Asp-tRNA(Asn)/Glu-tRNA(Gln) amidotransferase A subunit family amidase